MPTDSRRPGNSSVVGAQLRRMPALLTPSCDAWCDRCVKRTMLAGLLLPLLLGSCTATDDGPTAKAPPPAPAEAPRSGHLAGLRFDGATPQQAQALWSNTVA